MLLSNQYVLLALTFGVFYLVRRWQRQKGWVLLSPILITIVVLIAYLKFADKK